MTRTVSPNQLPLGAQLIDVRTLSEFSTGHIAGAIHIPLDELESRISDLKQESPLVLVCKGGTRARMAAELLGPCRVDADILDGGMDAWLRSGRSVVVNVRTRWSLERQVRLVAGILIVIGVVAGRLVHPGWLYLSGFVGLGLTFAGATDICGMGLLLSRMPWNRRSKRSANREIDGPPCALRD